MDPVVDAESGLIYLRARYYDPATGQFMSVDPLVALTGETYGYVDGNPLNGTDPLGLCGFFSCLKSAAHWVGSHPLQTVGIVVGAVALATGVGALALPLLEGALEGATVLDVGATLFGASAETLGTISTAAGFVGGGLDLPGCIKGSTTACIGAGANFLGGILGVGSALSDAAGISQLARIFSIEGLVVGTGASAFDAAHANVALGCRSSRPSPNLV